MDIDLLAKMVKEVVMDHDSVTLPGMGSFVAELVPASFADRGYTILPPYRRLYFSPKQGDDHLLAALYARSNDVSEADAARILEEFVSEMKEVLKQRKTLVLTGLGRLRATRENHFFFVADEDLDIYPSGFGLQPISLKTHEETPEEVAAAVSTLADIMDAEPGSVTEEAEEASLVAKERVDAPQEASPASEPEPAPEPESIVIPEEEETSEGASAIISATEEVPSSEGEPVAESEGEPVAEPEEEPVTEPVVEPEPEKKTARGGKIFGRILLILLLVVVLSAVALAVLGRVAPQWLDGFLYSPEELEILHP